MSRKKTTRRVKTKKPAVKHTLQKGVLTLAEKVEKEFRQLPAKLAKLYRQELMIQKQQQARLKTDMKKAANQQKSALKKQAVIQKSKTTTTSRKQLATAQKARAVAEKTIKILTAKLHENTKHCAMLLTQQNKFTLLGKELIKFEKQLAAKATAKTKKPAAKRTASTKSKSANKSKKLKTIIEQSMTGELPFMISPTTETVEE